MFRTLKQLHQNQRGITGLETAIILIAFVVVASVFAYTVLSAGIFSAEKGKEAIHSGLTQASSSMELVGGIVAKDTDADGDLDQLVLTVSNSLGGEAIDLTTTTDADADGIISDEASRTHVLNISYLDKTQRVDDITWTASQLGKGDGDTRLEAGEKMQITVTLTALSPVLDAYDTFSLELKPQAGSSLVVTRTVPAKVDSVQDLK